MLVDVFQLDLAQLGGLLRADRVFFLLELLEDGGARLLPLLLGFLQLLIELRADLFEVLLQLVFGIVETAGELGRDFLFGRRALSLTPVELPDRFSWERQRPVPPSNCHFRLECGRRRGIIERLGRATAATGLPHRFAQGDGGFDDLVELLKDRRDMRSSRLRLVSSSQFCFASRQERSR